jgi:hypothetical protein
MLFISCAIGGGAAKLDFLGAFTPQTSSGPGYTFSGLTLDDPGLLILCINGDMNTHGRRLNSVTVNGVGATIDANQPGDNTGLGTSIAAIASRVMPAGATGNIGLTFSGTMIGCSIMAYLLTRYKNAVHAHVAGARTTGAGVTSLSTSIDIPARGVLVATASCAQTSIFLSGADAQQETQQILSFYQFICGSDQRMAAETARAVSSNKGGVNSSYGLAVASWQ